MKVTKLSVENIKNIKAVTIEPDQEKNIITLAGRNGAGKSSVINSIMLALDGKSDKNTVRRGAEKGTIVLDLGDESEKRELVITRDVDGAGKSRVTVTNGEGMYYKAPQTMLNDLRKHISFDPLSFVQLNGKEQAEIILDHLGVNEQIEEIEEERKNTYDLRTLVNRTKKQREAQRDKIPFHFHDDIPEEEISITYLMTKLNDAERAVKINERKVQEINEIEHRIVQENEKRERMRKEYEAQCDLVTSLRAESANKQHEYYPLVEPNPTPAEIKQKIADAETINQYVRDNRERDKLITEISELEQQSNDLSYELTEHEVKKSDLLRSANLPEGMKFSENVKDGILYNDIPLQALSTGESIEAAAKILVNLNPTLKVMWIQNGSLLDEEHMAALHNVVNEYGFQTWVEVVDTTGNVGIVISEGEVIKTNP